MPRTKQFCEVETLEKAVELFWNKGFHATSMQDLVSHLGINRASLYGTYGDKHGLFKKAIKAYAKSNGELLKALLDQEQELVPGLRKMFAFISQTPETFSASPGCFVVNTAVEMLPNEPDYKPILAQCKEDVLHILRDFIARTAEGGLRQEEIDRKAYLTYAFQNGLQVMAKSENNPQRIQALIDDFLKAYQ
jgi:TetR/AcrR family transcriptional repressor of nem operon